MQGPEGPGQVGQLRGTGRAEEQYKSQTPPPLPPQHHSSSILAAPSSLPVPLSIAEGRDPRRISDPSRSSSSIHRSLPPVRFPLAQASTCKLEMAAMGRSWASVVLRAMVLLLIVQCVVGVTWGSFAKDDCVAPGLRKWYSRLYDIEGDWNTACLNTPATVAGQFFPSPTKCENKGIGGQWGEFFVNDATCNNA